MSGAGRAFEVRDVPEDTLIVRSHRWPSTGGCVAAGWREPSL
jgi:hypothetical protein